MPTRKAYQTLEDRGNYDDVEKYGPYICSQKNAWLGSGYYFWESFIENAHWWGIEGAAYKNGYLICESKFELSDEKCFNLIDNPDHIRAFNTIRDTMKQKGLYIDGKTTVARIVNQIKEVIKIFHYEAIRVYGVNSVGFNSPFSNRTIFYYRENKKSLQYLDSTPAIQICFYDKNGLNRKGFKIIHPPEYSEDYLV